MRIKETFSAIIDILYNFYGPHRPKLGLWGLIVLGFLTSLNAGWKMSEYGSIISVVTFLVCCSMWYILLPSVIFLIDFKRNSYTIRPRK